MVAVLLRHPNTICLLRLYHTVNNEQGTLEDHCTQLGLDPANITHLLLFPITAPITLTTRQTLHRACDDFYQDILRRKERVDRWVSRIITIAENIRELPEPFIEVVRLQQFQSMVGMLRVRWDQCAYLPRDNYDHALSKLFELAKLQDETMEFSYVRIEAPLCLSRECLTSLSAKLATLDQDFYTRQARIRAMEHILSLIYQDLKTPENKRVVFRNEVTVKYAAELGRELKALQLELTARKIYQSGECWNALTTVWDICMVSQQEQDSFRAAIEQDDLPFSEKLERIQVEIDTCKARFSKSGAVYKLMMTRSNHIERMISFEQSASDPKRLFQSSFQLVEEEKFRRRAYPTLLKLESTLIEAIEKFEKEQGERFLYEGVPYLETLESEIEKRHVNETVFAKFTPKIAAPTRGQTIQIMGRPISPIPAAPFPVPASTLSRPHNSPRGSFHSVRSLKGTNSSSNISSTNNITNCKRSNTLPILSQQSRQQSPSKSLSTSPSSRGSTHVGQLEIKDPQRLLSSSQSQIDVGRSSGQTTNADTEDFQSLKSYLLSHQRDISTASTTSLGSTRSIKSKSSTSSLSATSACGSGSASASNSPMTEGVNGGPYDGFYFGPHSSTGSSPATSTSTLISTFNVSVAPVVTTLTMPKSGSTLPKQDLKGHSRSAKTTTMNTMNATFMTDTRSSRT
ncbi:carboxypeptidase C prc1 [Mortierella claussenii]|nr:carboxypeptidase C prc1 [Mortierella claussenii]